MAVKIIKAGEKEFHGFCSQCGCQFTYELTDLKLSASNDFVECPTCGKKYYHPSKVHNPTIPGGIEYRWPSDATQVHNDNPCAICAWNKYTAQNPGTGVYIGDTPCTWCYANKVNCSTTGTNGSGIEYTLTQ